MIYHDVPVDGGLLRVAEWGPADGPVIVAVHGIMGSHLSWAALAEAMPEVRIVAPDLRGRGASSELPGPWGMSRHSDDVVATLDALALDRVVLIGHSMGAFVAVVTAHLHPDRVTRMLLIDGGLTLALPHGLTLDEAARSLVMAPDELSVTFADRDAHLAFWGTHPAFQEIWSPAIEAFIDYGLVGSPPSMHSRTSVEAVEQDSLDLYGTVIVTDAVAAIRPGTILLTAPRGLQNESRGVYSSVAVDRWKSQTPGLEVHEVDDVNHYTIILGPRGAAIVAVYARRILG